MGSHQQACPSLGVALQPGPAIIYPPETVAARSVVQDSAAAANPCGSGSAGTAPRRSACHLRRSSSLHTGPAVGPSGLIPALQSLGAVQPPSSSLAISG